MHGRRSCHRSSSSGYAPDEIPLNVDVTKFETWADAPGWVFHTGPSIVGNWLANRAPFRRHSEETSFHDVHRARARSSRVRIGLMSDFATGLLHSRFIARHLAAGTCEMVIHLKHVGYAGNALLCERMRMTCALLVESVCPVVRLEMMFCIVSRSITGSVRPPSTGRLASDSGGEHSNT